MLLIKNCKLVKDLVEGYDGEMADILVKGSEIVDIQPCGCVEIEGVNVVDMEGKYVLPGLFDLHIHLALSAGDTMIDSAKAPIQQALDGYKFALDSLYAGFTTLRDVGAAYKVAIEIRDSINSGKLVGPNIYASGRIITPTENGNDFFKGMYLEADKAEDMMGAVRACMKDGADFIKLMGTGAVMNPGGQPGQTICSDEEYEAIARAAEFKNTYVSVHCHGTEAMKSAIKAGIRTIEHASMMDDEVIDLLVDSNSYIVPTLSAIVGLTRDLPESSAFMKEKAENTLQSVIAGVTKAYQKGLRIGFGTDQGITGLYHGDNGEEFELRKELINMKEIDILKQATIDSATIIGVEEKLGSIKVGKIADLIAVERNPLEDITVMHNGVCKVIKSGVVIK